MSDVIIPDVAASDVPEGVEIIVDETVEVIETLEPTVNYAEKNLAELVKLFEELVQDEERMKKSKEAEAIKAAFYKRLQKEKAEAGYEAPEVEAEEIEEVEEAVETAVSENPFAEIERGFKELYNTYRKERADYNKQLEKEREHNLALKEAVIADLKALLENRRMSMPPSLNSVRFRTVGGLSDLYLPRAIEISTRHISSMWSSSMIW